MNIIVMAMSTLNFKYEEDEKGTANEFWSVRIIEIKKEE